MPNLIRSIKDPKTLQRNLSYSFRLLEKDLKREKEFKDRSIFPIDFSEVHAYLFPEFSQTSSRTISRLVLNSKNAKIQYGLFPPTIAEFFIHLFSIYNKIEGYANREKNIPIGTQDISGYVKKMVPGTNIQNTNFMLTQSEDLIHTIITLSDQKIVERSITNPCENFQKLQRFLEANNALLTFKEILPTDDEKRDFFSKSDKIVYEHVLNYLNSNPGRDPIIKPRMIDYNIIDALLAHQSYVLNRYYYKKNSEYFSIFTSSDVPIRALEQKELLFAEKPFFKTPLFRDPLYLFCREAFLSNISDEDELLKMTGVSADILERSDHDVSKILISDNDAKYPFKSVYCLLTNIINYDNPRDGLKEMMLNTLLQRFSNYKTDEIVSMSTEKIDFYKVIHNLDDYINLQKQDYEEEFFKTQEILIEYLNKLYLDLYPYVENTDFWAISPKMLEIKEKIKFG
jgi:hypothetical protein